MLIHDGRIFSDAFKLRLETAITAVRSLAQAEADRRGEPFLDGYRFNDTERVCYMACGELLNKHGDKALEVAEAMGSEELRALAMDCLVESASADHWYQYEKDYGQFEPEEVG